MKTTRSVSFMVLLLAIACASRAQTAQTEANSLGGTKWQLVKFQGSDGTTLTPKDKSKYTIAFDKDGTVSARIDCNRGHGTWKSSGPNQIEFGPLATTRAFCPPGSLYDQITKQWGYIRSYTLKDGHLFLALMADGGIYEYEPTSAGASSAAASTPPLENTHWTLIGLGDKSIAMAPNRKSPYFTLDPATKRVSGSGGCNGLTGGYILEGDHLAFRQMAHTMMACPEGMDTETAFLQALSHVTRWKITGERLDLFDMSGERIARFEAGQTK